MRFWWHGRGHHELSTTRPRVARAIERARQVQVVDTSLGSAGVDAATLRCMQAIERAAVSGPLTKQTRRAERGLPPELVWETARAAQRVGRKPEEVWAEALGAWLTANVLEPVAGLPRAIEARRRDTWQEIDETLRALRAS